MASFSGFPPRSQHTPVPDALFGQLLEQIDDLGELKCLLRLVFLITRKKGQAPWVTWRELASDVPLQRALSSPSVEGLRAALERCVARGTLLHRRVETEHGPEDLYGLNSAATRAALERAGPGTVAAATPAVGPLPSTSAQPNIFKSYEENIGLLTPRVAERLKDAELTYPAQWVEDAIAEAALRNKRSWAYVEAILRRWATEGRDDGAAGRRAEKVHPKEYLRRYGGHT